MHLTTNTNKKFVYCSLCESDFQNKYLQLCVRQFILFSKVGYIYRLNALIRHHEEHKGTL